jgi:hypothetical protein
VLQSISDCDLDYSKEENDRRSIEHFRRNDYQLDIKETTHCIIEQLRGGVSSVEWVVQEEVFTQNLVEELAGQKKPAIICEDNLGTIFLVKNRQVSDRTKHIDMRHHFMRDLQDKKELDVRFLMLEKQFSRYHYQEHNERCSWQAHPTK